MFGWEEKNARMENEAGIKLTHTPLLKNCAQLKNKQTINQKIITPPSVFKQKSCPIKK